MMFGFRLLSTFGTWRTVLGILGTVGLLFTASDCFSAADDPAERHVYPTFGVHHEPVEGECLIPGCLYPRGPGEPSNPVWPQWWSSEWTMYRVFKNYETYPPPYDSPPANLVEGSDYEVSSGATYYDSMYTDENGKGAMMEYYEKRCLPIFPINNHFTCAFVSLGDKAYFLTYDDRPKDMPPICRFSDKNHPPRRDFIKHLPYSKADSARLDNRVQAYSLEVGDPAILFGYAFNRNYEPDSLDTALAAYRHPHSFYFSGFPGSPPDAPIVSQNYRGFSATRPDPQKTWAQVASHGTGTPPWCCLFPTDCPEKALGAAAPTQVVPTWATPFTDKTVK